MDTVPPHIVMMEVDYAERRSVLRRSDGKIAIFPLESGVDYNPSDYNPIAKTTLWPHLPFLLITTTKGDDIVVELPSISDAAPLRGRPAVYLDQNAWSKIALALHEPGLLPARECDAALWLAELARSWRIVLPFSAGTLSETCHWTNNAKRYRLALTIADLSRGWQMLDPLAVRAAEMRWTLSRDNLATPRDLPQVWTLEPNAAFGARNFRESVNTDGFPPDAALTLRAVVAVTGTLASILDETPTIRNDPRGWAQHWAQLAQHVRDTNKPKHLTRLAVHGAILGDAGGELAQAALDVGLSAEEFSVWTRDRSQSAIGDLPGLGLAREVTLLKINNSTAKWLPNDLTDIFYLVHAAGYAEAVVGERSFVALLQQAQRRLERPVNAFKSIADLASSGLLDDLEQHRPVPSRSGSS